MKWALIITLAFCLEAPSGLCHSGRNYSNRARHAYSIENTETEFRDVEETGIFRT